MTVKSFEARGKRTDDFECIVKGAMLTGELQAMAEFCARMGECDWSICGDKKGNFIITSEGHDYLVSVTPL